MGSPSENLSAQDLREVLHIGRMALECTSMEEMVSEILLQLEPIFRTGCSNFFFSRTSDDNFDFNKAFSTTIEAETFALFRHYYHELDPFISVLSCRMRPQVLTTDQIITYKELLGGEYYNDFLKPQSIYSQMSVFLWCKERLLGSLNLFRPSSAPVFSSTERFKAELMRPYLAEAFNKFLASDTLREQQMLIDSILATLPFESVVVMDEFFEPVYCNQKAISVLSQLYNVEGKTDVCLGRLSEAIRSRLKRLRSGGIPDGRHVDRRVGLTLKSRDNDGKVRASIIPMKDSGKALFAVCIAYCNEEQELRKALKTSAFSGREVDVVLLLSRGLKNHEIGKRLYISEYTVENHLRSIYRKLGVSNRTAATHRLVKLFQPDNPFGREWGRLE